MSDFSFDFRDGDYFQAEIDGGIVRASFLGGDSWVEPVAVFAARAHREAHAWAGGPDNPKEAAEFEQRLFGWLDKVGS